MEIFAFSPRINRETIDNFNARVAEFCSDNAVINIKAEPFGSYIILRCLTADDVNADPGVPTLRAVTQLLTTKAIDLEEQLNGHVADAPEGDDEESSEAPLDLFTVKTSNDDGFSVVILLNGAVEDDDGTEEAEDATKGFSGSDD